MSIGVPVDIGKFGLEFARSYRLALEAINKIFDMGLPRAPSFAVADLPDASTVSAGSFVYVSNASGGAVLAFSDGSNWLRCDTSAIVT